MITPRLRLDPIGPEHVGELWVLHQDDAIAEWWGKWSKADAEERAAEFDNGWNTEGVSKWLAYDRETSELIGRGGLSYKHVDGDRRLEVGWAVRGKFWGHGFATEIGEAGLRFGFETLGASEIVAFTEPHNHRSRAVMERLQMQFWRDITHDGESFVLYGIDGANFRSASESGSVLHRGGPNP